MHHDKYKDKKFILIRVFVYHDYKRSLFKGGRNRTKFQHMLINYLKI